jgi:hypothetical protein
MIRGQKANRRNLLSRERLMGLFDVFKSKTANTKMDSLLKKMETDQNPKLRQRFFAELLNCKLFVATPGEAASELPSVCPVTNDHEETLGFIAIRDPEGKPAMIVFTGETSLSAWQRDECGHLEMPAADVFKMAVGNQINSLVINPKGPHSVFVSQSELHALAEGSIPQPSVNGITAQKIAQNKMVLGKPVLPPRRGLVLEVKKQSESHPEIMAAYIVQGVIGDGEPHLVIALQMIDGSSVTEVITPIAQSIQKILFPDEYVDFYPVFTRDEITNLLPQYGPPVYQASN